MSDESKITASAQKLTSKLITVCESAQSWFVCGEKKKQTKIFSLLSKNERKPCSVKCEGECNEKQQTFVVSLFYLHNLHIIMHVCRHATAVACVLNL